MPLRKLKPIRPGDKRYVHLTFKNHNPGELYATRRKADGSEVERTRPMRGTKTFVFEYGQLKDHDITRENFEKYLPNRGTVHDESTKRFLANAMDKGIKLRVGERTRGAKETSRFFSLWSSSKRKSTPNSYADYKKQLQQYCEWGKYRHRIIKREIINSLKDGSVEAIYGAAHSTIASDLRKAGIESNVVIEPTVFNWFTVVIRKAEKRKPIKEIDYKRAFVSSLVPTNIISQIERATWQLMIGQASEKVLDEMIANQTLADRILLKESGITGENKAEQQKQFLNYLNKFPFWKRFFEKKYMNKK